MAIAPRAVYDVPDLGVSVEILETAETTGGEVVEFEVRGRPRVSGRRRGRSRSPSGTA